MYTATELLVPGGVVAKLPLQGVTQLTSAVVRRTQHNRENARRASVGLDVGSSCARSFKFVPKDPVCCSGVVPIGEVSSSFLFTPLASRWPSSLRSTQHR